MSDRSSVAADWWKVVPCHFIWKLEENVHDDFKRVVNNLDSKLETRNDEEWRESACDMLLFRGYIEVSNFDGVQRNPEKAEEFFLEAEKEAMRVTDDDERQAYITVVTANRLWVFHSTKEGNADEGERSKLITALENSWMRNRDQSSRRRFDAFIDAIAAFALARLGPNKYKEGERRYQRALKTIKTKSSWYQSLGAVIGRQVRWKFAKCDELYDGINDEIKCYEKAIQLDPQNSSARCDLALALLRFPDRKDEAKDLMDCTGGNSCEIILKKGRFYRRLDDLKRALAVLGLGENLEHPSSEIFLQLSCVWCDLARQAKRERDWGRRTECNNNEMKYVDKCLELDPIYSYAKIRKAIALCKSNRHTEGMKLFEEVIEDTANIPQDKITAQDAMGKALFIQNRYKCNVNVARAYENVVDTGIQLMKNRNYSDRETICKFVRNAKEKLESYYDSVDCYNVRSQTLRNRLSEVGFDG